MSGSSLGLVSLMSDDASASVPSALSTLNAMDVSVWESVQPNGDTRYGCRIAQAKTGTHTSRSSFPTCGMGAYA